ncbi:hypothetical protein PSPO01_00922 [Paraphaeosphaeria sporulosa]
MSSERLLLLELWFADDEDYTSTMGLDARFFSPNEVTNRMEAMHRRILARCKCFLEVEDFTNSTEPGNWLATNKFNNIRYALPVIRLADAKSQVRFIHRTARDIL